QHCCQAARLAGCIPLGSWCPILRLRPGSPGSAGVPKPPSLHQPARSRVATGLPDVYARLQADPPARVADIGCGAGWSRIAIAQAYPLVKVDGFDLHETSVARATMNA